MGHGFIDKGKSTTFVSRQELAWHRLGKVVNSMTTEEAIKLGGLDFQVGLAPLYASSLAVPTTEVKQTPRIIKDLDGADRYTRAIKMPKNYATYRTDTGEPFGVVGNKYTIVQNEEAFEFFDSIIGEGHAEYETAGALGNGEKMFVTAKLPSELIVNKENINKYLLFTNTHDGSGAIMIMFTPIRVVCNNTLQAAVGTASDKFSIRHTKNYQDRLDIARRALTKAETNFSELEVLFNQMADKRMNDKRITEVICEAFGLKEQEDGKLSTRSQNRLEAVLEYHEAGVGQADIRGTNWGVYNAITGYQQNVQNYKDDEKHFTSLYDGTGYAVRQKAFNLLLPN
jgi:phage/plasmid-like protein (TIGR03299 family)